MKKAFVPRIGTQILRDYGIEHTFEVYDGDHTNRIAARRETKVLPFFSENLSFPADKKFVSKKQNYGR